MHPRNPILFITQPNYVRTKLSKKKIFIEIFRNYQATTTLTRIRRHTKVHHLLQSYTDIGLLSNLNPIIHIKELDFGQLQARDRPDGFDSLQSVSFEGVVHFADDKMALDTPFQL